MALELPATLYKYALPEYTASYTETLTSAPENGTLFYEQAVELTLHKLTANDRDEIKLLAAGRPNVILEDNNGNFILAGWRKGMKRNNSSSTNRNSSRRFKRIRYLNDWFRTSSSSIYC